MCDECTELSLAVHASRVDETSEASERQTTDSARSDFWAEETLSGEEPLSGYETLSKALGPYLMADYLIIAAVGQMVGGTERQCLWI